MDLAKIRQKARQEQENRIAESARPVPVDIPSLPAFESHTPVIPTVAAESAQSVFIPVAEAASPSVRQFEVPIAPAHAHRPVIRDPLEAILAGREAAGCDDELLQAFDGEAQEETDDYLEYLCFRVSDETYGINIMDIKEIIKPREVTEVPRAPAFVSGIISLRGVIIPIIDMLERLGLSRETVTGRERVIVVKHADSFSGLLVDEIIQVVQIARICLEPAPAVLEGIDRDFVTGIGRADGRMIILLNLENVADIHLY